jgi:hypothetical protein
MQDLKITFAIALIALSLPACAPRLEPGLHPVVHYQTKGNEAVYYVPGASGPVEHRHVRPIDKLPNPPKLIEITQNAWGAGHLDLFRSKQPLQCKKFKELHATLCFDPRRLNYLNKPELMQFRYRTTDKIYAEHIYTFRDHRPRPPRVRIPHLPREPQYERFRPGGSVIVK